MKISDYSINKFGAFIAGDVAGWPYRRGIDLVAFFNKLGFCDVYEEGFPTRRIYAQDKLKALNDKPKLKDVFREALDPRLWIDCHSGTVVEAAAKLNEIISFDGYEVMLDGKFYKVRELFGSIIEVEKRFDEISELSELLIEEQIRKSREKIEMGDYSGAITNSRSLIEAVCLSILNETNETKYENDGDLNKLFTQTRRVLNLDPSRKDISDSLKQVLSGLSSIVSGLSSMRNKMSDAHAGNYKPSRHHAKLAVNAAKTLADFIFETKSYQKRKSIL